MSDRLDTTSRTRELLSAKIAAEHEELDYHLRGLERLLEARDAFGSKRWHDDLRAWFRLVRPRMTDHFDHEEASHLYRAFIDEFPQLSTAVERLRREHRDIAQEMIRLERIANRGAPPEAARDLAEIVTRLRRHDGRERELVERAYYDDFGGVD